MRLLQFECKASCTAFFDKYFEEIYAPEVEKN